MSFLLVDATLPEFVRLLHLQQAKRQVMRRRRAPKRRPPLPTDGRPWHVDWFGCVRRAASGGETQVELLLSPIRRGWWSTGGYCHSASDRSFIEPGQQRVVPVSLDLFVRTPIGSVFLDGEHEEPIRYEDYEVGVSTERLRFIETDVALAGARYPVGGHGRGWCLELRIEADDTRVVVPVLEVLRFYYGTSSALLNALLSCDFDRAFSLVRDPARSRAGLRRWPLHRMSPTGHGEEGCPSGGSACLVRGRPGVRSTHLPIARPQPPALRQGLP